MSKLFVQHMAGVEMPADLCTKVLGSERFQKLKRKLGLVTSDFDEDRKEAEPKLWTPRN